MAEKRFGGVPPIVTALITISAVVAAGLVAWFLFATTSSAVRQPILEVTEAYAIGTTLRINVRNVGGAKAAGVRILSAVCTSGGPSYTFGSFVPSDIDPGQTASCTITGQSAFTDGTTCMVTIEYARGSSSAPSRDTITLSFKVVVP